LQKLSNIAANFRSALGLACVLALASASALGQSPAQSLPPLLLAKLRSAQKILVAPIREYGSGTYSNAPYYRKQVEETLERLYEVVPDGAGADLVFEPSIVGRIVRLAVRDPKTHSVLWMFSRDIKSALFPFNLEYNVSQALTAVLDDVFQAAGQTAMATPPAQSVLPSSQPDDVPGAVDNPITPGTTPPLLAEKLNSARSVFIASVNTENWGDRDFFWSQINSTVAQWGLYRLAPAATSADLVFEPSITGKRARVVVRDAKTRSALWMFSREVKHAILPDSAHDRLAEAIAALLDDLRQAVRPAMLPKQDAVGAKEPPSLPKVFISNLGTISAPNSFLLVSRPASNSGSVYSEFYTLMKRSGRFELMATPMQADLIFEAWEADPVYVEPYWTWHTEKASFHQEPTSSSYPQIKLVVWDRKTRATLVATTELLEGAFRSSTLEKNFSKAVVALVNKAELAVDPQGGKSAASQISLPHEKPQALFPAQIVSANKVFLAPPSRDGRGPGVTDESHYDIFQTELKDWGRYEVVANAADADLVLDLWDSCLTIRDPQTSIRLWAFECDWREGPLTRLRNLEEQVSELNPDGRATETADSTGQGDGLGSLSVTLQLAVARRIYLSSEGRYQFDGEDFDLVLKKARQALVAWGKYDLVATAGQADLVLEPAVRGMNLQMTVRFAKGLRKLGVFNQEAEKAVLYTTRQKNIGNAATALIEKIRTAEAQQSAGMPPVASPALRRR
jgi:hypothetical protein